MIRELLKEARSSYPTWALRPDAPIKALAIEYCYLNLWLLSIEGCRAAKTKVLSFQ